MCLHVSVLIAAFTWSLGLREPTRQMDGEEGRGAKQQRVAVEERMAGHEVRRKLTGRNTQQRRGAVGWERLTQPWRPREKRMKRLVLGSFVLHLFDIPFTRRGDSVSCRNVMGNMCVGREGRDV